ncbi:hypothetical protein KAU09_04245 [Candidatus Parcubacteria bacterium]|nr:hypothetical protein [Candidatus Parcubacteria bacterium]
MDERKELILNTIIKEHIKTGLPVSSGVLVEKYKLNISPATVRNEMAVLEDEEYIIQPHTSAGRIPTEKAYKLFIENIQPKKINQSDRAGLEELLEQSTEENLKNAAKKLSSLSGATVFWAFHRHNLYYTGISNLFQQPEFSELSIIYDISAIIDRIDEIINDIFDEIEDGINIRIGSDSPFGSFSGTIMAKYKIGEHTGLFGVLSPVRMDYEKNLTLINFVYDRLKII